MRDVCRIFTEVQLLHVDVKSLIFVLEVEVNNLPNLFKLGQAIPGFLTPLFQFILKNSKVIEMILLVAAHADTVKQVLFLKKCFNIITKIT